MRKTDSLVLMILIKYLNLFIKGPMLIGRYCLFILLLQCAFAADETESWNSIGFEKNLPYSLELEFDQEIRLIDQLSTVKQTISEISLSYKILDGVRIFIPLRYAIFEDKVKQRLSFGGSYKYGWDPVSLKYRIKLQRTYENGDSPEDLIRNRITIEYKLSKKIEPYVSGEFFHLYNIDRFQYNENRISFGFNVDLPKKRSIKIFYTRKKEDIDSSKPDQINIFGLAYDLKW
tara:strand:- start:1402 stop:2097 length:696 start_codon:yes stop_codon:yes gene_type:complete